MTHEKVRKKFFKENISSLKKCTDFDFMQWHVVVFQRERHVHCSVHYPASIIFLKTYQKKWSTNDAWFVCLVAYLLTIALSVY